MTYLYPSIMGCICNSSLCPICSLRYRHVVDYSFPTPDSVELQQLRQERDLFKRQLKESDEKIALIEEIEELKKKVKE